MYETLDRTVRKLMCQYGIERKGNQLIKRQPTNTKATN